MSMLQLNPTIPVLCKDHGYGDAFLISDVSIDVNPIYHVRFEGGIVKHFYSDDIRIVGNPMNGKGWDVKDFDVVHKLPSVAKRNTDFIKYIVSMTPKDSKILGIRKYYVGHRDNKEGSQILQYSPIRDDAKNFTYKGDAICLKNKLTELFPEYTFSVDTFAIVTN